MIYTTFAKVYDTLMDAALYDQWLAYTRTHLPKQNGDLLELACGSGTLALKLAQAGYKVTGLDLSEDMLSLADTKIQAAHEAITLVQGDIRDFDLPDAFDFVTCFDDSICYLPDLASVTAAFQQVYQALRPGGVFLFDAHSLFQMDQIFPGYMYNAKFEDMAFMWQSYGGALPHSIEHDLTFFVWDDSIQGYQALEELHKERTYALSDFQTALTQSGFSQVTITADFTDHAPEEESTRWFFRCQKNN